MILHVCVSYIHTVKSTLSYSFPQKQPTDLTPFVLCVFSQLNIYIFEQLFHCY